MVIIQASIKKTIQLAKEKMKKKDNDWNIEVNSQKAKDILIEAGIPANKISMINYDKILRRKNGSVI